MAKKKIDEPVYPVVPLVIPKERFIELLNAQIGKGKELLEINVPVATFSDPYWGYQRRPVDGIQYDETAQKDFMAQFSRWHERNKEIYRSSFAAANSIYYHEYEIQEGYHLVYDDVIKIYKEAIARFINQMQADIERSDVIRCDVTESVVLKKSIISKDSKEKRKIFIVHGHNEAVNQEVARVIEKLGLEAIILREQPNGGKTIIEKFESYANTVNFAVILLTADDQMPEADVFRARQNVIFEMGYFMGALGRKNVICLLQDKVEKPGDIDGVIYTSLDASGVWKYSLVKELKACGYDVDANKIM